jgi:hypothetical protein
MICNQPNPTKQRTALIAAVLFLVLLNAIKIKSPAFFTSQNLRQFKKKPDKEKSPPNVFGMGSDWK